MKQKETQKRKGPRDAKRIRERVGEVLQRMDALPTLDNRPEDEILAYDKNGIPTKGEKVSRLKGSGRCVKSFRDQGL